MRLGYSSETVKNLSMSEEEQRQFSALLDAIDKAFEGREQVGLHVALEKLKVQLAETRQST